MSDITDIIIERARAKIAERKSKRAKLNKDYYHTHQEEILEDHRNRRANLTDEQKEHIRELNRIRNRKYYQRKKAEDTEWLHNRAMRKQTYSAEYYQKNKERIRAQQNAQHALKRQEKRYFGSASTGAESHPQSA